MHLGTNGVAFYQNMHEKDNYLIPRGEEFSGDFVMQFSNFEYYMDMVSYKSNGYDEKMVVDNCEMINNINM